jgi:hypothetical protein
MPGETMSTGRLVSLKSIRNSKFYFLKKFVIDYLLLPGQGFDYYFGLPHTLVDGFELEHETFWSVRHTLSRGKFRRHFFSAPTSSLDISALYPGFLTVIIESELHLPGLEDVW